MMSIKYLVSKSDIKKLAKTVKKHSDSSNAEVFADLVTEFGYSGTDDFNSSLKKKESGVEYRALESEDLVTLGKLQEDICKTVTSDANDDFKLSEVFFIQEIIKKKLEIYSKQGGGYNLSTYLLLYPYVSDYKDDDGSPAKIITSEYLFNDSSLESFVYNILARYRAAQIPKSVFSKLLKVRIASDKDKKHIEKHKLVELNSYLSNVKRVNSAEELVIPLVFRGIYEDEFSVENFVGQLKNRIKLEHNFHKGFLMDKDQKLKIQIPVFAEVAKKKTKTDLVQAKKIIGKKSELLLGMSQPKDFLKTKSPLTIPKEKVLENIYLVGCGGCGIAEAHLSLLMSNIINGSGFLNISSAGDNLNFTKILAMAKMEDREKDCLYFNWENASLITPSMVREFVLNNRLVHIEFPCLEKSTPELIKSSCVRIFNIIKMFNGAQSLAKYPFTLGFMESNYLMNEIFRKLRGSVLSLNINNINLLISDRGWPKASKDRVALLDLIENQIVMANESDEVSLHFAVEKELIKNLKPGEFLYFYDKKRLSKDVYKTFYYSDSFPETYLNLPKI